MAYTFKYIKENFDDFKYNSSRSYTIPVICNYCGKTKYDNKHNLQRKIKRNNLNYFCDNICSGKYQTQLGTTEVECKQCGIKFIKHNAEIKNTKNNFCDTSCAGSYNTANKTHGVRVSKLEKHLVKYITKEFNNLELKLNTVKETGGYELDIYIPELKLAFEINGIFHYKPIYGEEKLFKIQQRDQLKLDWCKEKNIDLIIIKDELKRFTEFKAKPYEKIIYREIMARFGVVETLDIRPNI